MAKLAAHCIFCDLIRGAAEVSVCYEDARALAFMDIQPVNPGHVLVVPKAHHETLHDVPHDVAMHIFDVATGRAERDCTADLRGTLTPVIPKHHAALTDPKEVAPFLRAIDEYDGSFTVKCAMRLSALV